MKAISNRDPVRKHGIEEASSLLAQNVEPESR